MRQNVIIQSLIIIGILLALIISLYSFRGTILRSNSPNALKTLVLLFVPPIDLYRPLVLENIDISDGSTVKKFSYSHNYMGNHEVGIFLEKFDPDLYNLKIKLAANIECDSEGGFRYTRSIASGTPFLGRNGSGLSFVTYVVAKDLPLDNKISCIIILSGIDDGFIRKYGPASIFIKKISDM